MCENDLVPLLVQNLGDMIITLLDDQVGFDDAGWQVRKEVQDKLFSLGLVAAIGDREDLRVQLAALSDRTGAPANGND